MMNEAKEIERFIRIYGAMPIEEHHIWVRERDAFLAARKLDRTEYWRNVCREAWELVSRDHCDDAWELMAKAFAEQEEKPDYEALGIQQVSSPSPVRGHPVDHFVNGDGQLYATPEEALEALAEQEDKCPECGSRNFKPLTGSPGWFVCNACAAVQDYTAEQEES